MRLILALIAAAAIAGPARAQSDLEKGFAGALRGCQEWVLNPASWDHGDGPFIATVGLGDRMGLVPTVGEASMPLAALRQGDHYWRINATTGAGYILVVSDQLPMCYITGGGNTDLQPAVEAVLASSDFAARWTPAGDLSKGDMASTLFKNRKDPALEIVISRAKSAGQRLDRVQVLATALYKPATAPSAPPAH